LNYCISLKNPKFCCWINLHNHYTFCYSVFKDQICNPPATSRCSQTDNLTKPFRTVNKFFYQQTLFLLTQRGNQKKVPQKGLSF
jgi:hypothetical protein